MELVCIFVKNQLGLFAWLFIWILCSGPLICVSVPPATPYSLDYYSQLIISLEIKQTEFSHFFKIVLAILVHLLFQINCSMVMTISAKYLAGIFIRIVLNMHINLKIIEFLTMLSHLTHEYSVSPFIQILFDLSVLCSFQHTSSVCVL